MQLALEQIQLSYRLERQAAEKKYDKETIEKLRKEQAYPILCAFEKWLDAKYSKCYLKIPP
jgi:hypothetical protein